MYKDTNKELNELVEKSLNSARQYQPFNRPNKALLSLQSCLALASSKQGQQPF